MANISHFFLPSALVSPEMKIMLAIALVVLALVAVVMWLFPVSVWFNGARDRCPRCDSKDIRPSMISSVTDRLRLILQIHPYRCRSCRTRFMTKTWSPQRETLTEHESL
jgi:hypothetical protein